MTGRTFIVFAGVFLSIHKGVVSGNMIDFNRSTSDSAVRLNEDRSVNVSASDLTERKMKMDNALPFFVVPALAMAGIMPWIMPGLKMAAAFLGMINQMAFMSGLFMLARNYIFNSPQEEHVVYVNSGYDKKPGHQR